MNKKDHYLELTPEEMDRLSQPFDLTHLFEEDVQPTLEELVEACSRHDMPMLCMVVYHPDGFTMSGAHFGGPRTPEIMQAVYTLVQLQNTSLGQAWIEHLADLFDITRED